MKLIRLKGKYGTNKDLIIDDEDYDFISSLKIHVSDKGYAKTYYQGKHIAIHQLLVGKGCDHINRNRLDCRRENLRKATISQNNANVEPRAISGFKGVWKDPTCKNYRAAISVKGKMEALGSFKNPHHAALVMDLWLVDLHGEYAQTNFPIVAFGASPEFTEE